MLGKIFGTANDRTIKGLRKTVERINALEPELEALSDEALKARTPAFRDRSGRPPATLPSFATGPPKICHTICGRLNND